MSDPTFGPAELVAWSTALHEWQRDGLRRILCAAELQDADYDEVLEILKQVDGKQAVPAVSSHVGQAAPAAAGVRLLGLSELKNINALSKGPIRFAAEGLTIVYGDNGAGKSGVARVLKKVCRASDPGGEILPDVYGGSAGGAASATIEFRSGTEDKSVAWVAGSDPPSELARVTVFDADCAAVQVEKQNRISFTPAVLTAFQRLAGLCDEMAARLKAELAALGTRPAELDKLSFKRADSAAAKCFKGISADTDLAKLRALAALSDSDKKRRATVSEALKENPALKVQLTRATLERARSLRARIDALEAGLSDQALVELAGAREKETKAKRLASDAEQSFAGAAELPGMGAESWKALWEAARRYSTEAAYKDKPFPNTEEGSKCILCQQPLEEAGQARLKRFEEFVVSDLEKRAGKATRERKSAEQTIEDLDIPRGRDACAGVELDRVSPEGRALRRSLVSARLRRRAALRGVAPGPLGPAVDLEPVVAGLEARLEALQQAEDPAGREKLQQELDELDDRDLLARHQAAAEKEVERLKKSSAISKWLAECDTTKITKKAREAARIVISGELRTAFGSNLSAIGFASTAVEVVLGDGERAVHPYRVGLVSSPKTKPAEVLSEGEKTCVALAGFLAELAVTKNLSGIVFDDPVSSLDHRYRENVAGRLVAEAKERQVIILTHDVVFLWVLRRLGRESDVTVTELSLERGNKQHGHVKQGPPWVAMPVGARVARLRHELKEARRKLDAENRAGYELDVQGIYKRLRQTWERAVEEELLGDVVQRFGKEIQTKRLRYLSVITEQDIEDVTREMTRCSNYEHDEPGAVNNGIPEPDKVAADIKVLEDWIESLRQRRKAKGIK